MSAIFVKVKPRCSDHDLRRTCHLCPIAIHSLQKHNLPQLSVAKDPTSLSNSVYLSSRSLIIIFVDSIMHVPTWVIRQALTAWIEMETALQNHSGAKWFYNTCKILQSVSWEKCLRCLCLCINARSATAATWQWCPHQGNYHFGTLAKLSQLQAAQKYEGLVWVENHGNGPAWP